MKSVIITQDEVVVNFDNVVKIEAYGISFGNAEVSDDEISNYAIEALANVAEKTEFDGKTSSVPVTITLGIYDDESKVDEVMEQLIKWIKSDVNTTFTMPD